MAMNCCRKEYETLCVIQFCVDTPYPHNPGFYERLRFGLLASSWLPRPLGIFLWSALNAMLLIVSGPAFTALGLLAAFIFYGMICLGISIIVLTFGYGVYGVVALAIDFIFLLGRSMRVCWSVVWNYVGLRACRESTVVEWRGGAWFSILLWEGYKRGMVDAFWSCVPDAVPWWRPSLYYQVRQEEKLRDWRLWCEEVVHMHDAIAI